MTEHFDLIWQRGRGAFRRGKSAALARTLALSSLVGLGRRTVAGMICTAGGQSGDWTRYYRLFGAGRFDHRELFGAVVDEVLELGDPGAPVVVAVDDTIVRKSGRKTAGASWRRDPTGPHFRTNLVLGQRFLQLSLAVCEAEAGQPGGARMLPVEFLHCPTAVKPGKRGTEQQRDDYRRQARQLALSRRAVECLDHLRGHLDAHGHGRRRLVVVGDGGFTNHTVVANLPRATGFIGRIRKDAKLFAAPGADAGRPRPGRRRLYGPRLPTPEQIRRDESVPWQHVPAFAAGRVHDFRVKSVGVRWKPAGGRDLRLVVIEPLAYRPTLGSRVRYREPAHLICTDPDMPLDQLLQSYLWRWEIEVNFRDEKQLLGAGQANVRTPTAVQLVPALIVAAYAMLHLACIKCFGKDATTLMPRPKWRNKPPRRLTTADATALLRADVWQPQLQLPNCDGFANAPPHTTKPPKRLNTLQSAVLYARMT